jgi:hypothetical protein
MNDKTTSLAPMVWHYTIGNQLLKIVANGCLSPTSVTGPAQKRPILYFSRNQIWEPSANRLLKQPDGQFRQLTMDETGQLGRGLLRFGLEPKRLHGWPEIAHKAKMHKSGIRLLEKEAPTIGAKPSEWCGTTQPVPLTKITRIEVMDSKQGWVTAVRPLDAAIGELAALLAALLAAYQSSVPPANQQGEPSQSAASTDDPPAALA